MGEGGKMPPKLLSGHLIIPLELSQKKFIEKPLVTGN